MDDIRGCVSNLFFIFRYIIKQQSLKGNILEDIKAYF